MNTDHIVLAIPPMVYPDSPLIGADALGLIEVGADAGFDGVSICTAHPQWGVADDAAAEIFFDGSLALPVVTSEVIDIDLGGMRDRQAEREANARMLDLSARAGAGSVNLIALSTELPPIAEAAKPLGELCDLAAERGLKLNLEFLPWTGVSNLTTAARLLEAADRENLGLVFDIWHWSRPPEGPDLAPIREVPGEWIHVLQLDDVTATPDESLLAETVGGRLLPGEGVADIMGVLGALDQIGANPAIACEVFSKKLTALTWAESARHQYASSRATLDRYEASKQSATADASSTNS
jgi:sugar phosphate isomerase/epimerase